MLRSSSGQKYLRRILIAMTATLVPLIAGCEAGASAPTLHWHQPTDGTGKTVGNITISNAFVLGAPIGSALQTGQNAGLFLGLVILHGRDHLVGIAAPGTARQVLLPGNRIVLASQRPVLLTGPRPRVILSDLRHPLTGGSVVKIVLVFAKAGVVTMQVPVMPRAQFYTTLRPAPAPSPTKTITPGATPTATPKASSSP